METQIKFSLGGGKRIRTADPLHAMQVLYQLSYTPERENALYLKKITNANFSFHAPPLGLTLGKVATRALPTNQSKKDLLRFLRWTRRAQKH